MKNSNVAMSSSTYKIGSYTLTEPMEIGGTYTATAWGLSIPSGRYFSIYGSRSIYSYGSLKAASDGRYTLTFKPVLHSDYPDDQQTINIYQTPNDGKFGTVSWSKFKIEKGSESTAWRPAES